MRRRFLIIARQHYLTVKSERQLLATAVVRDFSR